MASMSIHQLLTDMPFVTRPYFDNNLLEKVYCAEPSEQNRYLHRFQAYPLDSHIMSHRMQLEELALRSENNRFYDMSDINELRYYYDYEEPLRVMSPQAMLIESTGVHQILMKDDQGGVWMYMVYPKWYRLCIK